MTDYIRKPTAIIVANTRLKPALEVVLERHHATMREHYGRFVATDGTADVLEKYLPGVEVERRGHGSEGGDDKVVEVAKESTGAGEEVDIYALFDWNIEGHQIAKWNFQVNCLQNNWRWFPTPATADLYLQQVAALEQCPIPAPVREEGCVATSEGASLGAVVEPEGQWMSPYFRDKLGAMTPDKETISRYVARELIEDGDTVLLDSGSTVVRVPGLLISTKPGVLVYTNNLHATTTKRCILLGGEFDVDYGATYPAKADDTKTMLASIEADMVVLPAAGITYEAGPLVKRGDSKNWRFKAALIRKCLDGSGGQLIIAVDWTKFTVHPEDIIWQPIVADTEWEAVRSRGDFVLVTTFPQGSSPKADRACEIIAQFAHNARAQGGLAVVDASAADDVVEAQRSAVPLVPVIAAH